jgi:hypothetical protein
LTLCATGQEADASASGWISGLFGATAQWCSSVAYVRWANGHRCAGVRCSPRFASVARFRHVEAPPRPPISGTSAAPRGIADVHRPHRRRRAAHPAAHEQTLEELEDDGVELLTAATARRPVDVVENQHPELVSST